MSRLTLAINDTLALDNNTLKLAPTKAYSQEFSPTRHDGLLLLSVSTEIFGSTDTESLR
jgi:hypothetical protein